MPKKTQEPEPEPVLRDLPEPKDEPEVDIKSTIMVFTRGVPQECIVLTEGPRGVISNSFTIVAHGGYAGAEIRVIGASNVTVG